MQQASSDAQPEEYYTSTGQEVVPPASFTLWFAAHKDVVPPFGWAIQEQDPSGTEANRVSAEAYKQRVPTLFPVSARYGWDISCPEHCGMIMQAQKHFKPRCKVTLLKSLGSQAAEWLAGDNKRQL